MLDVPVRGISFLHRVLIRIFPPSGLNRAGNIYVETLGLAGLFLYLFNINLYGSLHENGETMLIIAFLLAVASWGRTLVRQPLFWLMIAFAVALIISMIIGMENLPESRHKSEAKRMARLCLFVPLGWWIGANFKSIRNAFLIVCIGFIVSSLPWMLDWDTLSQLLEERRARGNITGLGAGDFGAWYGFLLLGLGILGREALPGWTSKGRANVLSVMLFFIIVVFLLIGLYASHWRTAWIALAIVMPLGLIIRYYRAISEKSFSIKQLILPLMILFLMIFFVAAKFEVVKNRFLAESLTLSRITSGQWEQLDKTSFGKRVLMYKWALETPSFVTAFGWGPRAIQAIGRDEELNKELQWNTKHGHLHNDLLAIMLRLGVFGLCVFVLIQVFLVRGVRSSYHRGLIPSSCYAFLMMMVLYAIIVGLTSVTFRVDSFIPVWMGLAFATFFSLDFSRSIKDENAGTG